MGLTFSLNVNDNLCHSNDEDDDPTSGNEHDNDDDETDDGGVQDAMPHVSNSLSGNHVNDNVNLSATTTTKTDDDRYDEDALPQHQNHFHHRQIQMLELPTQHVNKNLMLTLIAEDDDMMQKLPLLPTDLCPPTPSTAQPDSY